MIVCFIIGKARLKTINRYFIKLLIAEQLHCQNDDDDCNDDDDGNDDVDGNDDDDKGQLNYLRTENIRGFVSLSIIYKQANARLMY